MRDKIIEQAIDMGITIPEEEMERVSKLIKPAERSSLNEKERIRLALVIFNKGR